MSKNALFAAAISMGLAAVASASAKYEFQIPEIDAAKTLFNHSGDMDFDDGPGSLSVSQFEIRGLLSRPISPVSGVNILPMYEYKLTALDFDDFHASDEDLHAINLSALLFAGNAGSPWVFLGYGRAEIATDFQEVDGDDFTFDVAAAVGYRFNEHFILGAGAAVANLNGDETFYPAIGFDWIIDEHFRVGIYGPVFLASYTPCDVWEFSLRADSGGGLWNITDDKGRSRSYDLTSYRVGLFASRRLTGQLWLFAGAGATVGNEIDLTTPDGHEIFSKDLETGCFGQIGLRLKTW